MGPDLRSLPVSERLRMLDEIWESLSDTEKDALPLEEWQREELDRRLADLDAGRDTAEAWEIVRRRLLPKA